mmetsp:Transcript_31162/g.41587  ORF Transcript_31162/g.41587 Transcript_31162/m.41587 type:complete len:101 (-) Transcript_31162:99-401(-)
MKKSKEYYEQSRDLQREIGNEIKAMTMERPITDVEAKLSGIKPKSDIASEVDYWQKNMITTSKGVVKMIPMPSIWAFFLSQHSTLRIVCLKQRNFWQVSF